MKVERINPKTKRPCNMDLDITDEEICNYMNGVDAKIAFPRLSEGEIDFIKTGIIPINKNVESDDYDKLQGKKSEGKNSTRSSRQMPKD